MVYLVGVYLVGVYLVGASLKSCLTQQWCVTGSNLTLTKRGNIKAPLKHH